MNPDYIYSTDGITKKAITWAKSFGKPIITFKENNPNKIPIEIYRSRVIGEVVQQLKVLITGEEIEEATSTVDISACDAATRVVRADMEDREIQK